MLIATQLSDFVGFFLIGVLIAIIFDFFRTYRQLKKTSVITVIIQDIIYFFIATSIIIIGVVNILDSNMRLYIFIAIILGCITHFIFLSKHIINLYKIIFRTSKAILEFIFLPLNLILYIIVKICIFIQKITKKCCKKFFYVITFVKKLLEKINIRRKNKITKEGINYEKSI